MGNPVHARHGSIASPAIACLTAPTAPDPSTRLPNRPTESHRPGPRLSSPAYCPADPAPAPLPRTAIGAPNDNQRPPQAPFIGIERGPSRPTALTPCSNPKAAPHRWIRAKAYVNYWKSRSGELFVAQPVIVEINGLEVRVRPEVGIHVRGDAEVLHLWFRNTGPGRQAKQVILYFMDRARSQSPEWSELWNVGIWDVRRQQVPLPVRTAQDFELGLEGQAASFLRIWAKLDDAGEMLDDDGE